MDQIFQNFILHLPSSRSRQDIRDLLEQTIQDYGLNHFAYVSFPSGAEADAPLVLTTYPDSWVERYGENRYDRIDPVIARAVGTMLPFAWTIESFKDPLTRKQKAFLEEAAEAGIRRGLTIPIHDRQGKASSLTLTEFGIEPDFQRCIDRHQHALHLIALHLHAKLRQDDHPEPRTRPSLTPREIDCLQWAAKGKSASDIADIMRISRRTVVFHTENAKQKFGVATLSQAIARGLMHDIIIFA
ncbi:MULTISPECIES: helix-turn-helix transcriptional regulator [Inquilinus]|uniref:helix-turn-helix transcriptional regulator n=1 Tax=Inquilinus TaxID=171673 RepID=UPI00286B405A|nr:LuxR family transcriptional regulator [Inquilinus ginsengisoli]